MKAYRLTPEGGVDGLTLEMPDPEPGPGEVLVRVRATSLNYRDLLIARRTAHAVIPLSDGAGDVVATGAGVTRIAAGDRVAGCFFLHWNDGEVRPEYIAAALGGGTVDGMLAQLLDPAQRVAFFGHAYDRAAAGPLPAFLLPLRATIAQWAGVDSEAFAMALINEYRPGSPIGWHRDAPQYGIVAGVSLLSACRIRPYRSPASTAPQSRRRSATHEIALSRRSAYLMTRESRSAFEHHIPPVTQLRYSVTFRTLR